MPKNLGLYNDNLSTPRKKDVDTCYGPNNAPPYPVTSVDGKTGDVVLNATNIPFIVGTQKAATGSWTGVTTEIDTLKDGQTIRYWLPYNGSGNATLNLTLSNGSATGAINCYKTGTTRLTTQYAAGSVIILTYRKNVTISSSTTKYTGWWADADYTNYNATAIVYNGSIKCGTTAIVKGNIIVGKNGVYNQLNSGQSFDISYPILYTSNAISASATTSGAYEEINLTITTTQAIALTAYKPVFIQGTLYGNIFTPINTTPLTQTLPTSEDGYVYILLGVAYSTTNIRLLSSHPIFAYKGGVFGLIYSVVLNKGDVGLGNVDNVKQYSAKNPPPYPVTSVNSKSGAVTLSKADVGLSNVDNVKQYSSTNPPPYPVTSVNGQTGEVKTVKIIVSSTAPSNMNDGDIWYKILT